MKDEILIAGAGIGGLCTALSLHQAGFAVRMFESVPELRTPKVPEFALVSIPPFKVTGRLHILPERTVREALKELVGHFLPMTEATYWSERAGEPKASATMVAINHSRAQILMPWEG